MRVAMVMTMVGLAEKSRGRTNHKREGMPRGRTSQETTRGGGQACYRGSKERTSGTG